MGLLADLIQGLKVLEENEHLKPRPQTSDDTALMYTTRTETDGNLQVYEGTLPADMNGVFYVIYPVGSVNSGGLPFPETIDGQYNNEYGTPLMNGDGMILSIRFDGNQAPAIRSRLVKTPCYWADYNTRDATLKANSTLTSNGKTDGFPLSLFKFLNFGLSRMSMFLGARNLLNTAVIPVRFNNSEPFLLSTYDVGRPFIMDPVELKLQSPVGQTSDWTPATPAFLNWPFGVVQTTAHPSFDPNTQELFSVNYCKASSASEYLITQRTAHYLSTDRQGFKEKLMEFCEKMLHESDAAKIASSLMEFFTNLDHHMTGEATKTSASSDETSVWIMRWTGQEKIDKWTLVDQEGGNAIQIKECMHQTSLTEDYVVLTQTAFKFSLDLLINNPFPNVPVIDIIIRKILANTMLPYTDCYIVKRTELDITKSTATAYKLLMPSSVSPGPIPVPVPTAGYPIPVETIHYSCNYQNPNGIVTLYGIHNSSSCVAEWIRPYDTAKISGKPVDNDLIGMFALGSMDVNRIGKWVIDVNSLTVDTANSKQYFSPGKVSAKDIGPGWNQNTDIGTNTWTLGLYTYRDMVSPVKTVSSIKYIWYIANGMDPEYLTEFIYGLYENAADRILPVNDVMTYTKAGLPQTLVRMHCDSMQPDDYYQFVYGTYIRSTQFIPRPAASPDAEYELDGYIFCTMQVPVDEVNYRSEYWVFDAKKISTGPVCKLFFEGIQFCFTLHSTWLPSASPYNYDYNVDVRTDYNNQINSMYASDPFMKENMLAFFESYVYADWYAQGKNK
jgi:carotenoid cleavage dioxygenase-like enzyme